MTTIITDELRNRIIACVETSGVYSPESVCDAALDAAEHCDPPEAAFTAALEVIQRAVEVDAKSADHQNA